MCIISGDVVEVFWEISVVYKNMHTPSLYVMKVAVWSGTCMKKKTFAMHVSLFNINLNGAARGFVFKVTQCDLWFDSQLAKCGCKLLNF